MLSFTPLAPVDYLVIGHITLDQTPSGPRIGGTASYASLTARMLGLRVGIVTAWGGEMPLEALHGLPVVSFPTERSTTFENIYTPEGRVQILHHVAPRLGYHMVPEAWRSAEIVHLGPVAQEVESSLVRHFPSSLVGVTPQGWMRQWDENGQVSPAEWPESAFILQQSGACVLSIEDVDGDERRVEEMAASCRVLAVTEGCNGARVYWHGDVRRFRAPAMDEVDATGAGDIFAAAFFTRLYLTRDPWEAGRFATQLAAFSVSRVGLEGIPTAEEVRACQVEVF